MPTDKQFRSVLLDALAITSAPNASTILVAWFAGVSFTLVLAELPDIGPLLIIVLLLLAISGLYAPFKAVSAFALGFIWACWSFSQFIEQTLPSTLEGTNLSIVGVVYDLPDQNAQRSRFRFQVQSAQGEGADQLQGQQLQLSCYRCPFQLEPQQRWRFTVRLKRPHGYASWGAFDYEKYLFRHKILATGYVRLKSDYELLGQSDLSVNQIRWHLARDLEQRTNSSTDLKIPSVAFGMLTALTIGDKTALSSEQKQVFQTAGISHLLAISGLHIGLIFVLSVYLFGLLFNRFLRIYRWRARQQLVLIPSLMVAVGYAALAGFAVSTERALVMLCVYSLCRLFARELSLAKVLLIAASLILLFDPFSILDAGFWLSCGAVLVIALASERDQPISLLRLQPLIWLGMMPLTAQLFGQISLVSPFVNLLMVPLFCLFLIPMVFAAALLVMVGESYLSTILLWILQWCFEQSYWFLSWASQRSFANWYLPQLDWLDAVLMLLLIITYGIRSRISFKLHWFVLIPFLILLGYSPSRINEGEFEVTLLDVGQGLSMVIQTKNNVTVYDTGPAYSSGFSASKAVLIPYLRSRGIRRIDTLIISHADNDHLGGHGSLVEAYPVIRQLTSKPDRVPNAELCRSGQHWRVDAIDFEILSPDQSTPKGSNNLSCVLRVSNGHTSVLITGDIEKQVERYWLASKQDMKADILLVPHHGSKTSSSPEFIDLVAPKLALIAAGYRNRYGHPHNDVMQRYTQRDITLASTISSGSLRIKVAELGWRQKSFREAQKRFWRH